MMYNYPFFTPFHSRSYYGHNNYAYNYVNNKEKGKNPSPNLPKHEPNKVLEESYRNENSFFEIFGLKFYYDDILLICLIFFLYKENVKDNYLMLALVMLLLS